MLVIRLQTISDDEPAWATVEGNNPAPWTHGSWATLIPLTRGQTVVLLIPSRYVLLTRTTINTRNQRQLKQALPYALEDALAEDPEEQHIVWQAQADSNHVDVAIINRTQLREWLSALQVHQIRPQVILPDVFALPWQADTVTLWQQGEQVWIRTGAFAGYASISSALPLLLTSLAHADQPQALRLYSDQAGDWATDKRFTLIPETHAEQLQPESIQSAIKLNLLQGLQDESSAQLRQQWQRWRQAAVLVGITLLLAAGMYVIDSYRLQKQLDAVDSENLRLFTELFPSAGTPDARGLKNRFTSELASLKGKAGKTDTGSPLPALTTLASALAQTQGLQVEEIRSQTHSLTVNLQAKDQTTLESLRENLEKTLGSPVDMQSSRTADMVKATLTLGSKT